MGKCSIISKMTTVTTSGPQKVVLVVSVWGSKSIEVALMEHNQVVLTEGWSLYTGDL